MSILLSLKAGEQARDDAVPARAVTA